MSNGEIKLDTKSVGSGIFSVRVVKNSIKQNLKASDYVPFKEDLEFAGMSINGKPLGVPNSKGPATISSFPLKSRPPGDDWVCINGFSYGVLINTHQPEVELFIDARNRGAGSGVFIPRDLLPDRYSLTMDYLLQSAEFPDDVIIEITDPVLAVYFLRTFTQSKLVQHSQKFSLVLARATKVNSQDWRKLGRYVFTGAPFAQHSDTVPDEPQQFAVFFPGKTEQEVLETHGIAGKPIAFNKGMLGFSNFLVVDPLKAGRVHAALRNLGNKMLDVSCPGYLEVRMRMEEFLKNPRLIDASATLTVDSDLNGVAVKQDANTVSLLDYPLFSKDQRDHPDEVLCPKHLVNQFFFPVREASRTHKVEDIVRYTIKYDINTRESGKWLLRTEMAKLKLRNRKQELQDRKARKVALESVYGELPDGWEEIDDALVQLYFAIRQQLERGEIVPYEQSPFQVRHWNHAHVMIHWLKQQKQMVTCPITSKNYVNNYKSIEEMASVEGFLQMLEDMYGDGDFLRALITSPKVQAMALTELI